MMRARTLMALSARPRRHRRLPPLARGNSRKCPGSRLRRRSDRRWRLIPGPKLASQLVGLPVELEIVKCTDNEGGFELLCRRWVIERAFFWLRRNRRLIAQYEARAMIAVDAELTM